MREPFTRPSRKRKRVERNLLIELADPSAARIAALHRHAQGMAAPYDTLMRMQFLEGVANLRPGSWMGQAAERGGLRRALRQAKQRFPNAHPNWFNQGAAYWFREIDAFVRHLLGQHDEGGKLITSVRDLEAFEVINSLLAGLRPWATRDEGRHTEVMRLEEGEKVLAPTLHEAGRRLLGTHKEALEAGTLDPNPRAKGGGASILALLKSALHDRIMDELRRFWRDLARSQVDLEKKDEDSEEQTRSLLETESVQESGDAGDALTMALGSSPGLKRAMVDWMRAAIADMPDERTGEPSAAIPKFLMYLDMIDGMSPTEAADEFGMLNEWGVPRGSTGVIARRLGITPQAVGKALKKSFAWLKSLAARSGMAERLWGEMEDVGEEMGLGYAQPKWARKGKGIEPWRQGEQVKDLDKIKKGEILISQVGSSPQRNVFRIISVHDNYLMGQFSDPKDTDEPRRHTDRPIRVTKENLAKGHLYRAKKASHEVQARGLIVDNATRMEWVKKHLRTDTGFLAVSSGTEVSVHLNLHKRPYFSLKYPPAKRGGGTFGTHVVGYSRALELSNAFFFVADSGRKRTAIGGGSKTPFAGPTGKLTGIVLPEGSDGEPEFGSVASGGAEIKYNPHTFPAYMSLFFCRKGPSGEYDVPVAEASKVVMRDWKVYASGVKDMSDAEIDSVLSRLGLTRDEMQSERGGKQGKLRSDLIRLAYAKPELREKILPLVKQADQVGKIIADQMGGAGKLRAFLGSRMVKAIPNGLAFDWRARQRSRGNYVEITLQPNDTYKMEFYNVSVRGKKLVKTYREVYNDQLVDIFEKQTGWYLRI